MIMWAMAAALMVGTAARMATLANSVQHVFADPIDAARNISQ